MQPRGSALVKGASRQAGHQRLLPPGHARQQRQLQLHAAVLHAVHGVLPDLSTFIEVELCASCGKHERCGQNERVRDAGQGWEGSGGPAHALGVERGLDARLSRAEQR